MVPSITEEDKQTVKANFDAWCEIQDRKEQLNEENKTIVTDTSFLLDVKKPVISKLFKALKKRMEDGGEESDEVQEIIELVFGD